MNVFKGLMFLHGHFVRPEDLDDRFAALGNREAGARWNAAHPGAAPEHADAGEHATDAPAGARAEAGTDRDQEPAASLLDELLLLAGRPLRTRGRNLILDAPFEPGPAANDPPAVARRPAACATC